MKSQSGFTLIEMVVVIIILAIMAATAMPRFTNMTGEARLAALNGLTGALSSTRTLAQSKWILVQSGNSQNVDMNGTFISVIANPTVGSAAFSLGAPANTRSGIWAALDNPTGFVSDMNTAYGVRFWPVGVTTSANCYVSYRSGVVSMTPAASTVTACI